MAEIMESSSSMEIGIANHTGANPSEPCSEARVEVDMSAPFESVREAAARFGGFGFWKPSHLHRIPMAAQAAGLENEPLVKECETLEVMNELEATKEASFASICSSDEWLNQKLGLERTALEDPRERVVQKSLKVRSLEKDVDDPLGFGIGENFPEICSKDVPRLSCEAEESERTGENSRSAVARATAEIEDTRNKIETSEAVALAEVKAVTGNKNTDVVTISVEEYTSLTLNAKEDAGSRADEATVSKTEILQKVEEAAQEIKTSKRALEEALERTEAAYAAAKLEAERKRRPEKRQRRRRSSPASSSTVKFKNNPCPPQHRREAQLMDATGQNPRNEGLPSVQVLKPAMSIGQILSRKLLLAEEWEMDVHGERGRREAPLEEMLGKSNNGDGSLSMGKENGKGLTGKRNKFGFSKLSALLSERKKKKKKKEISLNLR